MAVSPKHTPGPWFVVSQDDYPTGEVAADPMGVRHVVTTYGDDAKANARLISAAPDLLLALHNMLEDGDKTDREQAIAAIRKATGGAAMTLYTKLMELREAAQAQRDPAQAYGQWYRQFDLTDEQAAAVDETSEPKDEEQQ